MKRSLAPPPALAGSDPTSLSPTPSRSSSTSSLDTFHAIGASLKRVKISTSPGELRLNRDLEEAALNGRRSGVSNVGDDIVWIPVDPSDPSRGGWADPTCPEPPFFAPAAAPQAVVGTGGAPRHTNPPLELRSSDGMSVLRRDPVDPLRMRLSVAFTTASERGPEACAALCECWTYLLQIPRMYPHSPPIVVRVSRSMPQLHQVAGAPTLQPNAAQATGGNGKNDEPPPLERVLVTVSPPAAFGSGTYESSRHHLQRKHEDSTERSELEQQDDDNDESLCWSEAKFDGWSPVSSLSDLLAFLVELPRQRREKWRACGRKIRRQRRFREQQEREARSAVQQPRQQDGQGVNGNGRSGRFRRQVSMTPYDDLDDNVDFEGSSGMDDDGIIGRPQPQAADEEQRDDDNDDMTVSSTSSQGRSHPQDRPDSEATKHALLPPNRFDVGYDRNVVGSIGLGGSSGPRIRADGSEMDQRWSENSTENGSGISPLLQPMALEASSLPSHPNFASWNSSTSDELRGSHANGRVDATAAGGGEDAEGDAGAGRLRSFDPSSYDDVDQHMMLE